VTGKTAARHHPLIVRNVPHLSCFIEFIWNIYYASHTPEALGKLMESKLPKINIAVLSIKISNPS